MQGSLWTVQGSTADRPSSGRLEDLAAFNRATARALELFAGSFVPATVLYSTT